MKNITDSFLSLGYWPSAGSFGFNTDILATNPINLSVVLGVLIFFGKGVFKRFIRKSKTENLEDYSKFRRTTGRGHGTTGKSPGPVKESRNGSRSVSSEWLFGDRTRKIEFDEFNLYDFGTIRKLQKGNHSFGTTKGDESSPTAVFQQALQGALGTLNSCLNNELHLRTISANIGMFGTMKEIK
ncbi:ATP synthase CF0 subunitI (chloroplast) [Prosopis cineraria]|uniref:ATP synthase CF0 subunitI n=1 Tax=Prosopis cineraria TaxID=364024 RepID=A0A7D4V802_9FABA|nr:ATP synthase CF0 subunitI [Prosopis cineraria]QKS32461.1 ATP synthase CF0 subunitI [Prosopis cineraria]